MGETMATENEIAWLFELEVAPEHREAFEAMLPEMIEATGSGEAGSRAYQFFANGTTVCAYERYDDSDAALEHMKNFGATFAQRFMTYGKPVRFTLLGNPSPELAEVVAPIGAVVHTVIAGYVK
jgi:quinol monooxygenase YgiN